jgi:predicted SAM-dependent methyltransferase
MDFSRTRISVDRSVWSYGKLQSVIGTLIRNRKFQVTGAALKSEYLNVGCGLNPAEGFCNIDFLWRPSVLCFDITRGIPLPDCSLRGIFTEHCLEHISYEDCLKVLRDFRRMLKPGGVARVVVPDGELYCDLYTRARAGEPVQWPYHENGRLPIYYVNRIMSGHGHKFIYDFDSMKDALLSAGFREVHRASFRNGSDPTLLIDQEHRAMESLYAEGIA